MYLNTALRVDFDEMDYELISIRNNSFKMAADILKICTIMELIKLKRTIIYLFLRWRTIFLEIIQNHLQ